MHNKSEDFLYIEECIGHIKAKEDICNNLQRISRALARIYNLKFEVSISNNEVHRFFGVNVFPSNETIRNMCALMYKSLGGRLCEEHDDSDHIVKEWQKCDCWRVEFDADMLYDISIKYSAPEIAAAMVHEIIDTVYTSTIPITVFRQFNMWSLEVKPVVRALLKHEKIQSLLHLAVLEACESKIFRPLSDEDEDGKVMRELLCLFGYRDDYTKLLERFVANGQMSLIEKTYKDVKHDIKIIMTWITNIINELEFNKTNLKDALESEKSASSSEIVKQALTHIRDEFFEGAVDNYRVLLSEQWHDTPHDAYASELAFECLVKSLKAIATESVNTLFDKNGYLKKVTQLDIDILVVEAGRITTHDDKVYVLNMIYDRLKVINSALDYMENKDTKHVVKQSKASLLDMKKQLEDLRKTVLATRIVEKDYGVFIRYPKGYEG